MNIIDSAIPSAIAAGLGALQLRNRLRSLNENKTTDSSRSKETSNRTQNSR